VWTRPWVRDPVSHTRLYYVDGMLIMAGTWTLRSRRILSISMTDAFMACCWWRPQVPTLLGVSWELCVEKA
jgi:hypothetical protein